MTENVQPQQKSVSVGDIELSYFEWGQKRHACPTLLFAHATGFHARCWDQIIAQLGNVHAIAVDQRGHGRSGKSGEISWAQYGRDMTRFVQTLNLTDIVAVGHSLGGHVMAQTAVAQGQRFVSLLLVDPVIVAPKIYAMSMDFDGEHPVTKRKNNFDSVEEMVLRFAQREPYSLWDPRVLHDYCQYGLLPTENGFQLACPPRVEGLIYMSGTSYDIYDQLATINQPVTILRARQENGDEPTFDLAASPTYSKLVDSFALGEDHYLPELSHFIPMQRPDLLVAYISKLLAA